MLLYIIGAIIAFAIYPLVPFIPLDQLKSWDAKIGYQVHLILFVVLWPFFLLLGLIGILFLTLLALGFVLKEVADNNFPKVSITWPKKKDRT